MPCTKVSITSGWVFDQARLGSVMNRPGQMAFTVTPRGAQHLPADAVAHRRLPDIAGKGPDPAPALLHFAGGPRQRIRVARVERDVGAGLRRRESDRPAEAAAAAGDEKALAVEPEAIEHVHRTILERCWRPTLSPASTRRQTAAAGRQTKPASGPIGWPNPLASPVHRRVT